MKKTFFLIVILTFTTLAWSKTEISRIKERGSNRQIILSKDDGRLLFEVTDGYDVQELNRVEVDLTEEGLSIASSKDHYNFNIIKSMAEVTKGSYKSCWVNKKYEAGYAYQGAMLTTVLGSLPVAMVAAITPGAATGLWLTAAGVAAAPFALCAVVPAIPFVVGVFLLPVDISISKVKQLSNPELIAIRKFRNLLKGKDKKIGTNGFNYLLNEIKKF